MSEGITAAFSKPTMFLTPNSANQYASVDPTIPPTPTITTSAVSGSFRFFIFCSS
jgi:hypothetical protein